MEKEKLKLFKMYQKSSAMVRKNMDFEHKILKQEEKVFGEKTTSEKFVDNVSSYASNGEFNTTEKEFMKEVNEELKNAK